MPGLVLGRVGDDTVLSKVSSCRRTEWNVLLFRQRRYRLWTSGFRGVLRSDPARDRNPASVGVKTP